MILELYIRSNITASGMITMPKQSSFTTINFQLYPGTTRRIILPTSLAKASGSKIIEDKGIDIETDNYVSVYAMNKRQYSADMTVLLPKYSLGNDFFFLSNWKDGKRDNNANSVSEFLIVSVTDATKVEITPAFQTINGNPAGVPFRLMLQKGQSFQLRAKGDLKGTQIVTTNQSDCQNFAVFSGNKNTHAGE